MPSNVLLQPTWKTRRMTNGIVLWIGELVIWNTLESSGFG